MALMDQNQVPFPESAALNTDCSPATDDDLSAHSSTEDGRVVLQHIPDEPSESLAPRSVQSFLHQELNTDLLDELYPHLWMVGTRASKHIDRLHMHAAKGREIMPIEDPALHLVWATRKVYIKPIPVCLLNYHFWRYFLLQPRRTSHAVPSASFTTEELARSRDQRASALGFLRSYSYLVQHRSDFALAQEHNLIPKDVEWASWQRFIVNFRSINEKVARRYNYGQLRLSRLNLTVPLVSIARIFSRSKAGRRGWFYYIPYWSIGRTTERTVAILILIFATLSLVLSSMQVALAITAAEDNKDSSKLYPQWNSDNLLTMADTFWIFSMIVIAVSALIWALLLFFPLGAFAWQLSWGFSHREKDEKSDAQRPTTKEENV